MPPLFSGGDGYRLQYRIIAQERGSAAPGAGNHKFVNSFPRDGEPVPYGRIGKLR